MQLTKKNGWALSYSRKGQTVMLRTIGTGSAIKVNFNSKTLQSHNLFSLLYFSPINAKDLNYLHRRQTSLDPCMQAVTFFFFWGGGGGGGGGVGADLTYGFVCNDLN